MQDKYRVVFCQTQYGPEVFADIMQMLNFMCPLNTGDPRDPLMHNLAVHMWARLGVVSEENRLKVISALMSIPPAVKQKDIPEGDQRRIV